MTEAPENAMYEAIGFCGQTLGMLYLTDPKNTSFIKLRDSLLDLTSLDDWPFGDEADIKLAYKKITEGIKQWW